MADQDAKACRVKFEIIYDNGEKLKGDFPNLEPNIGAELVAYLGERKLDTKEGS